MWLLGSNLSQFHNSHIVGCYMLRPFAHPVTCRCVLLGVVAAVCTPLPTRTHQLPTLVGQQCWEMLRLIKLRTNWRNIVSHQLPTLLDVGRWGPKPSCKRTLEHRALLRMMAREKQNLRVESEEQALGSRLREKRAKRRYFCFALPPYPWERTTWNKSPSPGPKGRTCPRGCPREWLQVKLNHA